MYQTCPPAGVPAAVTRPAAIAVSVVAPPAGVRVIPASAPGCLRAAAGAVPIVNGLLLLPSCASERTSKV